MTDRNTLVHVFGILGNLVSVGVYLAPTLTFKRIIREKSTTGFQCTPYVVALFSASLWLYYALLESTKLLITINAVGCIIQSIYIVIFAVYSPRESRIDVIKLVSAFNVGAFCAIFLVSEFVLKIHPRQVQVVGWICVAFSVGVFIAPLGIVFQVVRTKNAEFLPVGLSVALTISAVMWFLYGFLVQDLCVALPNIVGFFLGTIQVGLWCMYRKSKSENNSEEEEEEKKSPMPNIVLSGGRENVIDILVLENSDQVHPIAIELINSDKDAILTQAGTENDQKKNKMENDTECVALPAHVTMNMMHIENPVLIHCQA